MAVNHLGHFALLGQLLDLLGRESRAARVVCVSSLAHRLGDAQRLLQSLSKAVESKGKGKSKYNAWAAYFDSKLANVLFAKELNRRFQKANALASAVSLHPGHET